MESLDVFLICGLLGVMGFILMGNTYNMAVYLRSIFRNSSGEGEAGGKPADGAGASGGSGAGEEKRFTQKDLDYHISERLKREQGKYSDYEDLRKFKEEHDKAQQSRQHEDLVKQKKYEEAEGTYKKQIGELSGKISELQTAVQDRDIRHGLANEISRNGGYIEESIALLRGAAVIDNAGSVMIKGKDANGIDKLYTLAEGVKQFLTERPHLVKANHKPGAGSGGGNNGDTGNGAGGVQGEDLASLNALYQQEIERGTDLKKISELKQKIKAKMSLMGVNR